MINGKLINKEIETFENIVDDNIKRNINPIGNYLKYLKEFF